MFSWSTWLGLLIKAVLAYITWKAADAEVRLRTFVYELKEKIAQETIETENEISKLRAVGRDDDADKLRKRLLLKTSLIPAQLPTSIGGYFSSDERRIIFSSDGRDLGIRSEVSGTGTGKPTTPDNGKTTSSGEGH